MNKTIPRNLFSPISPLSVQALVEDLDVAHTTVSRWLNALKQVYYHFEIKPYSKSISRSLKKEGKIYLYDWSAVESPGPRFENMVASHLLKMINYYNDIGQADLALGYLRDKEKNEIDFIVYQKKAPLFTVEAKLADIGLASNYQKFQSQLKIPHFQICNENQFFRSFKPQTASAAATYVIGFDRFFARLP